MPGRPLAFSGRSEQRSDSHLSNALADQGFKRATQDISSLPAGSTEAAVAVRMPFPLGGTVMSSSHGPRIDIRLGILMDQLFG